MIINLEMLATTLAIAWVAQYLTDKAKYPLENLELDDRVYSVIVGLIAFVAGLILTVLFNVELFTSANVVANYILTATFVAGGSSAINSLVSALQNTKKDSE